MRLWRRPARSAPADAVGPSGGPPAVSDADLVQVRALELRIQGLVDSVFAGEYPSVFRGRGLEFSHLREYSPGDDPRSIDWKVTARRGAPFVKQHVEERELNVLLVVDVSASTRCGTGPRAEEDVALELCSALAVAATRSGDRVGLVLFADEVERYLPPGAGRRRALDVMLALRTHRPRGRGTRPARALEFALRVCRPRSLVFLVSDFVLGEDEIEPLERVGRAVAMRHDLVPVRLSDPVAESIPDLGTLALLDPETGRRRLVPAGDPAFRGAYGRRALARRARVGELFAKAGVDAVEVDTREGWIHPLRSYLQRRERRHR